MIHRFEFLLENTFPWGEKLQESYEFSLKLSTSKLPPSMVRWFLLRNCSVMWRLLGNRAREWGKVCKRQKKPKLVHLFPFLVKRLGVLLPSMDWILVHCRVPPPLFSIPSGSLIVCCSLFVFLHGGRHWKIQLSDQIAQHNYLDQLLNTDLSFRCPSL